MKMVCTEHVGDVSVDCAHCVPCSCPEDHTLYDKNHGGLCTPVSVIHQHLCSKCRRTYTHAHKMAGKTHKLSCPTCQIRFLCSTAHISKRCKWICLLGGLIVIAVVTASVVHFIHQFTQVADDALDVVVAGSDEIDHTIVPLLHSTGRRVRSLLNATGEDADVVLNATVRMASMLARASASTLDEDLDTVDGVIGVEEKVHQVALYSFRRAMHMLYCVFTSQHDCDQAFYGIFHLCGNKEKVVQTDSGKLVHIIAPCENWGREVKVAATVEWHRFQWHVRTEALVNFINGRNATLDEVRTYISENSMREFADYVGDRVCNHLSGRERGSCYHRMCAGIPETAFEDCVLRELGVQDLSEPEKVVKHVHPKFSGAVIAGLSNVDFDSPTGCQVGYRWAAGRCREVLDAPSSVSTVGVGRNSYNIPNSPRQG